MPERTYKYTILDEAMGLRITYTGEAMNFAQMLGKIERRYNLEIYRIVEIREIGGRRRGRW